MKHYLLLIGLFMTCVGITSADDKSSNKSAALESAKQVKTRLDAEYKSLDALYKHFHSHPELSLEEEETAARLAGELRKAGFDVTEKVGGHGVVAVLKNGDGPTHSNILDTSRG